jgi:hypothetical protein
VREFGVGSSWGSLSDELPEQYGLVYGKRPCKSIGYDTHIPFFRILA